MYILPSVISLHVYEERCGFHNTYVTFLKFCFACRDCVGGAFEPPNGPVRQCTTQCSSQTLCVAVQVPEEHLKVK